MCIRIGNKIRRVQAQEHITPHRLIVLQATQKVCVGWHAIKAVEGVHAFEGVVCRKNTSYRTDGTDILAK